MMFASSNSRSLFCTLAGLALFLTTVVDSAPTDSTADNNNSTAGAQAPDKSACLQQRDRGDKSCDEHSTSPTGGLLRYYYDRSTKHCQPFMYLGCGGNGNRFESLATCRDTCSGVVETGEDGGHGGMVIPVPKCDGGVRAAVNKESQVLECDECPAGYRCQSEHCCPSEEHTCDLEYDTGKYAKQGSHTPRYFYNKAVNNCLLFTYYGALGNANNFETYNECVKFCVKQGGATASLSGSGDGVKSTLGTAAANTTVAEDLVE